jgi:hypothetical protein
MTEGEVPVKRHEIVVFAAAVVVSALFTWYTHPKEKSK